VVPVHLEIRADKSKFKQVLYNLLSNASSSPQGGKVWVSARTDSEDLIVDVGDTGVGIPAEHHKRIFDEFYQLDHATTRQVEGTGLGLSLTRRSWSCRWEHLAGERPGRGSVFTFRLPLAELRS